MPEMTPAEAAIRREIAEQGPMTFRRFMEMALYAAPGAYYASSVEQIGARGDYFTSAEIHSAFGALVARQVEQVWIAMGRPSGFKVVEIAAGNGTLARDILAYAARWSADFLAALDYHIMERDPDFARRQQQTIAEAAIQGAGVSWHSASALEIPLSEVEGCFLSNELPDAFPVHRVAMEGGALREIYVTVSGDRLAEILGESSEAALASYFDRLRLRLPEGAKVEVNLQALEWMREVARALSRGAVITIDYGYPAEDLYSEKRREGSLLCFYRHTVSSNPYVRIGRQDMTTHVDFTSLALEGEVGGLTALRLATQRDFLSALGMNRYAEILGTMGLRRSDYEANRLAMRELMDLDGLGRVKVLIQQKGLDGFVPAGLRTGGIALEDLGRDTSAEPPPLLTRSHMRLDSPPNMDLFVDTQSMWNEMAAEDED